MQSGWRVELRGFLAAPLLLLSVKPAFAAPDKGDTAFVLVSVVLVDGTIGLRVRIDAELESLDIIVSRGTRLQLLSLRLQDVGNAGKAKQPVELTVFLGTKSCSPPFAFQVERRIVMIRIMKRIAVASAAVALAAAPALAQSSGGAGGGSAGGGAGSSAGAGGTAGSGSLGTSRGAASGSSATTSPAARTSPGSTPGVKPTQAPVPSAGNSPLNTQNRGTTATETTPSNGAPGSEQPNSTSRGSAGMDPNAASSSAQSTGQSQQTGGGTAATDSIDPSGASGGTTSGSGGGSRGVTGDSSGTSGAGNDRAAFGASMDQCMSVWDKETHMTKEEWRRTCERTTTR